MDTVGLRRGKFIVKFDREQEDVDAKCGNHTVRICPQWWRIQSQGSRPILIATCIQRFNFIRSSDIFA